VRSKLVVILCVIVASLTLLTGCGGGSGPKAISTVDHVVITPTTDVTLNISDTQTLTPTAYDAASPANAVAVAAASWQWSVLPTGVVTLVTNADGSCTVTAAAAGDATVTVRESGSQQTASRVVHVPAPVAADDFAGTYTGTLVDYYYVGTHDSENNWVLYPNTKQEKTVNFTVNPPDANGKRSVTFDGKTYPEWEHTATTIYWYGDVDSLRMSGMLERVTFEGQQYRGTLHVYTTAEIDGMLRPAAGHEYPFVATASKTLSYLPSQVQF
jgi:hypothetical protein